MPNRTTYRRRTTIAAIGAAVAVLLASVAGAQTVNSCQAKKKSCVAKKTVGLLHCHELAERTGTTVDGACTQKVRDKFDGAGDPSRGCFGKLEATGSCLTTHDTADLESKVDAFLDDVVSTIDPAYPAPAQNVCAVGKKKCIAREVKTLLACHSRAEKTGTLDPGCVQHAKDKFDGGATPSQGCFAKLEAKGGCLTTDDTDTVETKIDDFIHEVVCALDPSTPECSVPTPTPSATPATTPTTTPGGLCPLIYRLTVNGAASDVDIGWTGNSHDNEMPSNARLTFAVSGCANALTPCGQCSLSGLVANAGGAAFQNRRCRGDETHANGWWIGCSSDADCAGPGNACVWFFGPPQPLNAGGVPICAAYETGAATGTIDSDTGDVSFTTTFGFPVFTGESFAEPCPACVAGVCDAGDRTGQPCTVQGTSAAYGEDVSLDCPPSASRAATSSPPRGFTVTLSTAPQSLTLDPTSPNCTSVGFTGLKCQCSTCNDAAGTLCHTDADCVAVGATSCGGRRCIGGANDGTPCTTNSECPSGGCAALGAGTAANDCNAPGCSADAGDTASSNEGICAAGPMDTYCALQRFHSCTVDADCTTTGDHCVARPRECFTDNGIVGNAITSSGSAADAPTIAGVTCMAPTNAGYFNSVIGLPGPARFTLRAQGELH